MGNQAKRNYISDNVTAPFGSWLEITTPFESYFSIFPEVDLLLSVGHTTPSEGTAVSVPANVGFELPTGVLGPVFIQGATAAGVVNVVGA